MHFSREANRNTETCAYVVVPELHKLSLILPLSPNFVIRLFIALDTYIHARTHHYDILLSPILVPSGSSITPPPSPKLASPPSHSPPHIPPPTTILVECKTPSSLHKLQLELSFVVSVFTVSLLRAAHVSISHPAMTKTAGSPRDGSSEHSRS